MSVFIVLSGKKLLNNFLEFRIGGRVVFFVYWSLKK